MNTVRQMHGDNVFYTAGKRQYFCVSIVPLVYANVNKLNIVYQHLHILL